MNADTLASWPVPFHLLRPWWLLALPALALLWWRLRRSAAGRAGSWRQLCDAPLLQALLERGGDSPGRALLGLLAAGWLLAVLALAGPTWDQRPQPLYQSLHTRVVVLDLSQSMLATDLTPAGDRITLARYRVADLLRASRDGLTGLVVFAGDAFVVAPITRDVNTLLNLVPQLSPAIMPAQGNRLDLALRRAGELLAQSGGAGGDVIVLTDGDNGEPARREAATLAAAGYRVSVIGVGTRAGAPIRFEDGRLLTDNDGTIVIARLDEASLRALAEAGNGLYTELRADGAALEPLLTALDLADTVDAGAASTTADLDASQWRERGPWLLPPLLLLAALAFRRGWLLAPLLALLVTPPPALAWGWDDLWRRPDQQAHAALQRGAPDQALHLTDDPWLRGTGAYRSGDYAGAAEAFARRDDAIGHYNRGNALAQLQRFDEALAAYDRALTLDPQLEPARQNRAVVERLRRQQQAQTGGAQDGGETTPDGDDSPDDQDGSGSDSGSDSDSDSDGSGDAPGDSSGDNAGDATGDRTAPGTAGDGDSAGEPRRDDTGSARTDTDAKHDTAASTDTDTGTGTGTDSNDSERAPTPTTATSAAEADVPPLDDEQRQAIAQRLRRVRDDPGGLLARKFQLQHRRQPPPPPPPGAPNW